MKQTLQGFPDGKALESRFEHILKEQAKNEVLRNMSDTEADEFLNYLLQEETELEGVRDRRVFYKVNDTVDNIFASDSNSNGEFTKHVGDRS